MIITKDTHPHIHKAFDLISHDSGNQAGHESFNVPTVVEPWLAPSERALSTLSDNSFEILCIGEQSEQEAIVAEGDEDFKKADQLLKMFFEGFDFEDDSDPYKGLRLV